MSSQIGKINSIRGIFAPSVNFNVQPVERHLKAGAATIKGNTSHPVAKSDFANEYFTAGYHTKADNLDYLA